MERSSKKAELPDLIAASREAPKVNPLYMEIASADGTTSYEYVLRKSRELRRSYDARAEAVPQRRSLGLNSSQSSRSLLLALPGGTTALALTEEAMQEAEALRKRQSMTTTSRGNAGTGADVPGLFGSSADFAGFDPTVTQLSPDAHAAVVTALLSASDVHQLRALGFDLDGNGYLWLPPGVGSRPDPRLLQSLGAGERMVLQTLAATQRQRVHVPSFLRAQQTEFARMSSQQQQQQGSAGLAGGPRSTDLTHAHAEAQGDATVHVRNPMHVASRSSAGGRSPGGSIGSSSGGSDLADVVDFYRIEQCLQHAMSYGKMVTIASIVKIVIALLRLFGRDSTALVGLMGVLGVWGATNCQLAAVWVYGCYCLATSILCAYGGALVATEGAEGDLSLVTSARGNSAIGTLVGTGVFALIGLYGSLGFHATVETLYDCGWETTPWTHWLLQHVVKPVEAGLLTLLKNSLRAVTCGMLPASTLGRWLGGGEDGETRQSLQGSILLASGRRGGLGVEVMGSPRIVRVVIQNRRQAYVSQRAAERRWEFLRGQALTADDYRRSGLGDTDLQQVQVRAHHVATSLTDPLPALPSAGAGPRALSPSSSFSSRSNPMPLPQGTAQAPVGVASPARGQGSSSRLLQMSQQSPSSRAVVPVPVPSSPSPAGVVTYGPGGAEASQQTGGEQEQEGEGISAPVYAARARTRPVSTASSVSTGSSPVEGLPLGIAPVAGVTASAHSSGSGTGAGAGGGSGGGRLSRDSRGARPTLVTASGLGSAGPASAGAGVRHSWATSRPAELVASIQQGRDRSRSPVASAPVVGVESSPPHSRTRPASGSGRPTAGQDAIEGSAATGFGVSVFGVF